MSSHPKPPIPSSPHFSGAQLIEQCRPALEKGEPVTVKLYLKNTDRSFTTTLSHEIMKTKVR